MILRLVRVISDNVVQQATTDVLAFEEQAVKDTLIERAYRMGFVVDGIEPIVTRETGTAPIRNQGDTPQIVHRLRGELTAKERVTVEA